MLRTVHRAEQKASKHWLSLLLLGQRGRWTDRKIEN
jgi:hypothetical protein